MSVFGEATEYGVDRPCNRCSFDDLQRRHGATLGEDMGMPCAIVNGQPVAWFAALPATCVCEGEP